MEQGEQDALIAVTGGVALQRRSPPSMLSLPRRSAGEPRLLLAREPPRLQAGGVERWLRLPTPICRSPPKRLLRGLSPSLDSGEYRPLGESTSRRVDLRVVGATNKDDSGFREDFLARHSLCVRLPPLSDRREDIPLLIRHWLLERARQNPELGERLFVKTDSGRLEPRLSAHLVDHLVRSPLSANVRELRATLLASVNACQGNKLTLPPEMSRPPSLLPAPKVSLSDTPLPAGAPSKEELEACLAKEKWNVSEVARVLELSRGALYRLMETYGLERKPKPGT
jgi:two-component system response regulator HydG